MLGLATPFKTQNYGTKLQAYAMQNIFSELGYDVEIIDYTHTSKKSEKLLKIFSPSQLKHKIDSVKNNKKNNLNQTYTKCITERNKEFNNFTNSYLTTSRPFFDLYSLKNYSQKYDAVICGSDQIWLPSHIKQGYFSLSFVPGNVRRIAYAPSLGISNITKKEEKLYRNFLNSFDYLSCREISGCEIINKISDKKAETVADPTLLVDKNIWDTLSGDEKLIEGDYIFCYFIGNNPKHRNKVKELSCITGCKIVNLPHIVEYVKADEEYADFSPYNIGPEKFVNLIKNAKYICTDSFHGSVFSTIFEKEYFVFQRFYDADKQSTNSRLTSLLKKLNLECRQISNDKLDSFDWKEALGSLIDYDAVRFNLKKLQNTSMQYICKSLDGISCNKQKHIEIKDKNDCCGCSACADICPQNCITMKYDSEGFLYPSVDTDKCINCTSCLKACPIQNFKKQSNEYTAYAAINKDDSIKKESTSGGLFTPLANKVIENGGVVIGAAFDDEYNVVHTVADNLNEVWKLRGSKYVQSNTKGIYKTALNLLKEGKTVLFSGTPCQIRALKSFLKKDYENLICVDLFCHGVPSPKIWNKYLDFANPEKQQITNISFRDKRISWENYSLTIKYTDNEQSNFWKNDPYARCFGFSVFNRPSCGTCRLKSFPRVSDITLGDLWLIDRIFPEMSDHKGVSFVIVNTDKGSHLFNSIENAVTYKEIPKTTLASVYPVLGRQTKHHKNRNVFFEKINDYPFDKLSKKYATVNRKQSFVVWRSKILNKLGLRKLLKKIL